MVLQAGVKFDFWFKDELKRFWATYFSKIVCPFVPWFPNSYVVFPNQFPCEILIFTLANSGEDSFNTQEICQ